MMLKEVCRMKEWYEKHKSEIIVGIVVFFITTSLSWLASWLKNSAPSAGRSLLSVLRDMIYYNAGRQSTFHLLNIIVATFFSLFFAYIMRFVFVAFQKVQSDIDLEKLTEIEKTIDAQKDGCLSDKDYEFFKKRLDRYKKRYSKKASVSPKRIKVSLILYSIFIFIFVLYVLVYIVVPSALWQTFELTITRVSPYIEDGEIKMIRSQWVSMKTVEDFNAINSRLLEIREQYSLIPQEATIDF